MASGALGLLARFALYRRRLGQELPMLVRLALSAPVVKAAEGRRSPFDRKATLALAQEARRRYLTPPR